MGSKEDVAARIDADTKVKIDEMNAAVAVHKDPVSPLASSCQLTLFLHPLLNLTS